MDATGWQIISPTEGGDWVSTLPARLHSSLAAEPAASVCPRTSGLVWINNGLKVTWPGSKSLDTWEQLPLPLWHISQMLCLLLSPCSDQPPRSTRSAAAGSTRPARARFTTCIALWQAGDKLTQTYVFILASFTHTGGLLRLRNGRTQRIAG